MPLEAHFNEYVMKSCPIDNSIKILGRKLTLHILRNMMLLKQKRFSEFIDSIERIGTKTLSIQLNEMEEAVSKVQVMWEEEEEVARE